MAGHFGCFGGGQGEVVFGDVEEFRRVFCAGFVGYGGADAFVAEEVVSVGEDIWFSRRVTAISRDSKVLTHLIALPSFSALPSAPWEV